MSNIFVIIFLISGILGIKKPRVGIGAGCLLTLILYFVFFDFEVVRFIIAVIIGFAGSFAGGFLIPWFFSGFRGGKHNQGPFYGGSGTSWGSRNRGIILTDEEKKNSAFESRKNKRKR